MSWVCTRYMRIKLDPNPKKILTEPLFTAIFLSLLQFSITSQFREVIWGLLT